MDSKDLFKQKPVAVIKRRYELPSEAKVKAKTGSKIKRLPPISRDN